MIIVLRGKCIQQWSRFPSNPERKKQWATNLGKENWTPSKPSRICSDHFEERFIDRTGKSTILKFTAVPTRFKEEQKVKIIVKFYEHDFPWLTYSIQLNLAYNYYLAELFDETSVWTGLSVGYRGKDANLVIMQWLLQEMTHCRKQGYCWK